MCALISQCVFSVQGRQAKVASRSICANVSSKFLLNRCGGEVTARGPCCFRTDQEDEHARFLTPYVLGEERTHKAIN